MRFQDDINTEHNMKSICRAAVAQWTKRLTRNGYTLVQNWKGANILLLHYLVPTVFGFSPYSLIGFMVLGRARTTVELCLCGAHFKKT